MRVPVTVSHPHQAARGIAVNAVVDPDERLAVLPASIVDELRLPTVEPGHHYAQLQAGDIVSVTSVAVSSGPQVVLGLAALTGLCLEVDRRTGRLRRFTPRI